MAMHPKHTAETFMRDLQKRELQAQRQAAVQVPSGGAHSRPVETSIRHLPDGTVLYTYKAVPSQSLTDEAPTQKAREFALPADWMCNEPGASYVAIAERQKRALKPLKSVSKAWKRSKRLEYDNAAKIATITTKKLGLE